MAESTVDILETIADATIMVLSLWAGWLFSRNYQRSRTTRAAILTGVFLFVGLFKAVQLVFESFLGLESFAWMDTNLASETLIVLFAAINIVVISGGMSWRGRLSHKPGSRTPENMNKAA